MHIDRLLKLGGVLAGCLAMVGVCASASAPNSVVEIGTLAHASYRIDIPANWNHDLIVFYHGYTDGPVTYNARDNVSPMFDPMLKEGYAVLQSGYSAGGWAVEQGYADTEKLRQKFVAAHGSPKRSYVMGMSMGGTLAVMTIEQRPQTYTGALSLCGAIEPSNRIMQRDFALRAAFDYYFPGLLGALVPVSPEYRTDQATERKIAAALRAKPDAARALMRWYAAADANNIVPVILFVADEVRELQQRTHGNPFGNADLIYVGTGDDYKLNDGVKRYRADPLAAAYLAKWYTPTGVLTRPFLALQDTGDPLVPANAAFEYALQAERAGHGDDFVQLYVNREGHCVFTPEEVGLAFDKLAAWSEAGKRPQSGKLR
ncbi:MAG: alpha/beta hydrolase family protein [Rudaea sp.]